MHDARDAEDIRLLDAGEVTLLVESYYGVILDRCRARVRPEHAAIGVAAEVAIRGCSPSSSAIAVSCPAWFSIELRYAAEPTRHSENLVHGHGSLEGVSPDAEDGRAFPIGTRPWVIRSRQSHASQDDLDIASVDWEQAHRIPREPDLAALNVFGSDSLGTRRSPVICRDTYTQVLDELSVDPVRFALGRVRT